MDKVYNQKIVEEKWYKFWEESGFFKPEVNPKGEPYCIILPPPNANAPLHFGHAMYVVEDILIRYHRMKGFSTLWLPGSDHAGFETQVVFEKQLEEQGKSRFDFDREILYQMIWDFVQGNKGAMESQVRRLGFSVDWSREKFTLDPDIAKIVYKTFKKLFDDGLLYRASRLVNYCTYHGTSFSDLEVVYEERKSPLYYIKYGPLTLATTRPETKFGDTGVAVHPDDKRYQKYVGKAIEIETVLGKAKIKVVADEAVDPKFGTGVVKVTPAHDPTDFEIGQRHNLVLKQVIDFDGRLNKHAGKFSGMKIMEARKAVVEAMKEKGLIEKIDEDYTHRIGVCYKCATIIEPLPLEQWFINMKDLAKKAIEVVKKGEIKIYPKRWESTYFQWLENIKDWNISRQIVWGMQIPAWYCRKCKKWTVTEGETPAQCVNCKNTKLERDEDVFDTWFSSGQWPYATLQTTKRGDFEKFYPTSVMETMYDILLFWVARMVMLGIYATGKIPFKHIVLHGKVLDPLGKKMSKSKGNVVDPIEVVDQYGADAARMALVYGTAFGNDQSLSHPKLAAMRNFTNKLWNMARFIEINRGQNSKFKIQNLRELEIYTKADFDKKMIKKTEELVKTVTSDLEKYNFNHAAETLYDFAWHTFADKYIEDVKNRINEQSFLILNSLFIILLKLLHPFMPFVTEEIYQKMPDHGKSIMIEKWPS